MAEQTKKGKMPMPFSLTNETQARFKSHFDKSTDEVMNALLDAYEQAQSNGTAPAAPDTQMAELKAELERLTKENTDKQAMLDQQAASITAQQEEITRLQQQQQETDRSAKNTAKFEQQLNNQQQLLEKAQSEISELHKTVSDKDDIIEKMKQEVIELSRQATGVPQDYQEIKDHAGALEDQAKQDRKVINGLRDAKKEQDKIIEQLKSENTHLNTTIRQLHESGNVPLNAYPEGDILHFFPPLCSRLIDEVCQRLTAEQQRRNPDAAISPQMMLGDMFLRYIIQRYNTWFFRPMLSDSDIVRITQEIAPDIQSIRQLKQILGIRD